jgi:hypothetical protein
MASGLLVVFMIYVGISTPRCTARSAVLPMGQTGGWPRILRCRRRHAAIRGAGGFWVRPWAGAAICGAVRVTCLRWFPTGHRRCGSVAPSPSTITVDGKALSHARGRIFIYFRLVSLPGCRQALDSVGRYEDLAVPTAQPPVRADFLRHGSQSRVSNDLRLLKRTFPLLAILRGRRPRSRQKRRHEFEDPEPAATAQLGFAK